jgi:hypothetical protein
MDGWERRNGHAGKKFNSSGGWIWDRDIGIGIEIGGGKLGWALFGIRLVKSDLSIGSGSAL